MGLFSALDPATIGAFQNMLGVPVTMSWDPTTATAMSSFLAETGRDQNKQGTDSAGDWEEITAALRNRQAQGPNPAMEDPAYQAFLRMSGVQTANIKNEIQARIEQTQRENNRAAAGYAQQKDEQTRNIGLDYEDRGFYSSGARTGAQGTAAGKIDYARQQDETARNDALASANRTAEGNLAEIGQKRAEEEIAARTRVTAARGRSTYDPTSVGG